MYKDPSLPIKERVADLVSRMTLEEKISQMVYRRPGHRAAGHSGVQLVERVPARRGPGRAWPPSSPRPSAWPRPGTPT